MQKDAPEVIQAIEASTSLIPHSSAAEDTGRSKELNTAAAAYVLEYALSELGKRKAELRAENSSLYRPDPIDPNDYELDESAKKPYPTAPTPRKIHYPMPFIFAALAIAPLTVFLSFSSAKYTFIPDQIAYVMLIVAIAILYAGSRRKRTLQKKEDERTARDPEYLRACKAVDQENQQKLQSAIREMQLEQQRAIAEAEETGERIQRQIRHLEEEAAPIRQALEEVYAQNIIPGKYRNLNAVTFLATFMGTSNYDLKFAIERFDKEVDQIIAQGIREGQQEMISLASAQKMLTASILHEQRNANYLNEQILELMEKGNDILNAASDWTAAHTAILAADLLHSRKH